MLRGRLRRALGAVGLAGLWLLSPLAWSLLVGAGVVSAVAWAASRLLPRGPRIAAWAAIGVAAFVLGVSTMGMSKRASHPAAATTTVGFADESNLALDGKKEDKGADLDKRNALKERDVTIPAYQSAVTGVEGWLGQENARVVLDGGIVQGVAPVALPLPAYERSVVVTRELVTRDQPLTLGLVYVTNAGLAPLVGLWLVCLGWLGRLYSVEIARLLRAVRERLARRPDPDHATPAPVAPPPVVA